MTAMDDAWNTIFESGHLLDKIEQYGFVLITPKELKKLSNREPRLLAKLDDANVRPEVFKKNGLAIIAVQNDLYLIFKDRNLSTYYSLDDLYDKIVTEEYVPARDFSGYDSLNISEISSETQAIDVAFIVSLVKTFTNEKELLFTIRGRHGSENFKFNIPVSDRPINVSGVQIEIDAGYESTDRIYIVEAKIGRRENFNIRQLFYPYKDWSIKSTKEIVPILFIYTNGLFYFIQFKFGQNYGDLTVTNSKCYTINEKPKQQIDINMLISSIKVKSEPDIPYPQANDLDKIIDIVTYNKIGLTNKTAIAEYFDFDERQGDYYANAAIYLGLLKRKNDTSGFELTREGEFLSKSNNRGKRNFILLKQMLSKPTFNEIINTAYIVGDMDILKIDNIANVIQKYTVLNPTTARRRSSTVNHWIKWINDNIEFV